jgi:sugar phosphate isomerase/epimerase
MHVRVPWEQVDQHLDLINSSRLDLEIYFSGDVLDIMGPDEPSRVMDRLTHSPAITIHAPFMDLNPGAVDTHVLEATRERYRQAFRVAESLRPVIIVFHSGYEKWKYDHDVDLWLKRSLDFWPEFIERAGHIGTRIAIENIFEDEPGSLARLMEALDTERAGICFDAGHCNLFTRVPLQEWLEVLGPFIIETHIHDNAGDFDSHLALGDGNIDFESVFRALEGRDVIHTIEALTPEDTLKSIKAIEAIRHKLAS